MMGAQGSEPFLSAQGQNPQGGARFEEFDIELNQGMVGLFSAALEAQPPAGQQPQENWGQPATPGQGHQQFVQQHLQDEMEEASRRRELQGLGTDGTPQTPQDPRREAMPVPPGISDSPLPPTPNPQVGQGPMPGTPMMGSGPTPIPQGQHGGQATSGLLTQSTLQPPDLHQGTSHNGSPPQAPDPDSVQGRREETSSGTSSVQLRRTQTPTAS